MKANIQVVASSKAIKDYRRLLLGEWTRETIDEVLGLLYRALVGSGRGGATSLNDIPDLRSLLAPDDAGNSAGPLAGEIVARIGEFAEIEMSPGFPAFPVRYERPRRPSPLARQAERAWTFLTVRIHVRLSGDIGFFPDLQSLLFLQCTHHLLPALKEIAATTEHAILLHAANLFAHLGFRDDPAHFLYLQSVLMDYLSHSARRLRCLHDSFRLTADDDHSFLTKAQEYWSALLDQGEFDKAESFLLSLYRSAPVQYHEEIRQMIDAAMRQIVRQQASA